MVVIQTIPALDKSGQPISNKVIFHRLFWSFKAYIDAFAFCKPIVQIDGTWLYGRYKGTLLITVVQDGANNIFPLAFAIVEGETVDGWHFFLQNLRTCVTPQHGICLISDRHELIKSAYRRPDSGWTADNSSHVFCIQHICQNYIKIVQKWRRKKKHLEYGQDILFIF